MAAAGSRNSETQGDLSVSEVGAPQKRYLTQGTTVDKKSSNTGRVGGDKRLCLCTPTEKPHGAKNGGGERGRNGGLSFVPSAVSEPR